jgi:chromosome segregation ATPase
MNRTVIAVLAIIALALAVFAFTQRSGLQSEMQFRSQAEKALANAEGALKGVREQASQLGALKDKAEAAKDRAEAAKDKTEAALKSARDQIGQLEGAKAALQTAKEAAETSLKAVRDQVGQLQTQLQAAKAAAEKAVNEVRSSLADERKRREVAEQALADAKKTTQ